MGGDGVNDAPTLARAKRTLAVTMIAATHNVEDTRVLGQRVLRMRVVE